MRNIIGRENLIDNFPLTSRVCGSLVITPWIIAWVQSLIKPLCFALGFYEALLGLLNPVDCSLWTTRFYAFILYWPCIFLSPSFPPSLLSYYPKKKEKEKKTAGISHKNIFWMKRSASWPFYQLCTPKTLYMHLAYSHPTKWTWYSPLWSSHPLPLSVLGRPFWSGGTTWFVWCTTWFFDIHSAIQTN